MFYLIVIFNKGFDLKNEHQNEKIGPQTKRNVNIPKLNEWEISTKTKCLHENFFLRCFESLDWQWLCKYNSINIPWSYIKVPINVCYAFKLPLHNLWWLQSTWQIYSVGARIGRPACMYWHNKGSGPWRYFQLDITFLAPLHAPPVCSIFNASCHDEFVPEIWKSADLPTT